MTDQTVHVSLQSFYVSERAMGLVLPYVDKSIKIADLEAARWRLIRANGLVRNTPDFAMLVQVHLLMVAIRLNDFPQDEQHLLGVRGRIMRSIINESKALARTFGKRWPPPLLHLPR